MIFKMFDKLYQKGKIQGTKWQILTTLLNL